MAKIKKTFRLESDLVDYLQRQASAESKTITDILEDAVRQAQKSTDKEIRTDAKQQKLIEALQDRVESLENDKKELRQDKQLLIEQLSVKDEQITALNTQFLNAQALQAAEITPKQLEVVEDINGNAEATTDSETAEKPGILQRLINAFK